jgi:hypothetical protein
MWPLKDLDAWSLLQKGIKSPLKGIDAKTAVTAEGFERLPFQHPLSKPYKTIF